MIRFDSTNRLEGVLVLFLSIIGLGVYPVKIDRTIPLRETKVEMLLSLERCPWVKNNTKTKEVGKRLRFQLEETSRVVS